ncbi:hypothetical protein FQN50_007134 [Emmonsiellopsis sp. PD_5]|nr:hypothetical protein FQN50_007134 [Emmonsiellopsis sp. PD_5]
MSSGGWAKRSPGLCQSTVNSRCEQYGMFVPGVEPPWPCPGSEDVQCCVRNEDVTASNYTSIPSSTPPPTSTSSLSPVSSLPVPNPAFTISTSTTPHPSSTGSSGLSAEAKGGIAGGVVGGVIIIALIAMILFLLRRRQPVKNDELPSKDTQDETPTAAEKRNQENPLAEKAYDDYDRKKELCGSPLSELACHNGVQELESPGNDFGDKVDASYATHGVVQRTQAPVELYGTSAI